MKFRLLLTIILPLVLFVMLSFVNRARVERIAQKEVEVGCSPQSKGDCWLQLAKAIEQHPFAYRFHVSGYEVELEVKGEDLHYDRRNHTILATYDTVDSTCPTYCYRVVLYESIDDSLLHNFVQWDHRTDSFNYFCRVNGCRVQEKDNFRGSN